MIKIMSGKIITAVGIATILFLLIVTIAKVRTGYNSLVFLGAALMVAAGLSLWLSAWTQYSNRK